MQITELHPPINGVTSFCGMAVTRHGRRYSFCSTLEGEACCVQREKPYATTGGRTFWIATEAPKALRDAVRKAVLK
jgi:hypothetical protein